MINLKSLKWCLGIAVSLGLCACMDMQRSEHANAQHYEQMNAQKAQHTTAKPKAQKTYASKDPTQKATPGPKRNTAPQIPVIQ
ncbi:MULTISPECIES: hypothetical protein [Legionella]|uniref:Lipoprotein n=1 Tax=Legionella steelei TaxID=947033 RepID=A0A0W0ZKR5_9GAMM|nr:MULTISPECIES: hypothetical protein [Legionella]KTD69529.1 hypothetical protein Lste_2687 [Legionella steelei]MBN9227080.1 hypothetical protein [Legionella steelei]OJW07355.1 MAG: hypothetical protein BGO44_17185 [Legionella sp. 39-23]